MDKDDGPVHCRDSGEVWPLFLPQPLHAMAALSSEPISVQHLLDRWTQQEEGFQGLLTAPPLLCLQVNRFNASVKAPGHGKSDIRVEPDPYVFAPVFSDDLQSGTPLQQQHVRYQRAAAVIHLGQQSTEGSSVPS